jgi:tetratricopeptide (TPR) repeat protein
VSAGAPGGPDAPPRVRMRAVLDSTSEQNMAALRRSMARAKSFSLLLVIADGPARAELRARLREWSGTGGVPALRFFGDGDAGAAEVEAFLSDTREEPVGGAVILDGDVLVERETPVLALNMARDRLGKVIAGPLVIVLSPRREAELSRMAPDLFDVRSTTYEVEAVPSGVEDGLSTERALAGLEVARGAPAGRVPLDAERLRALEESPEPPPLSALADEWLRLALDLVGHNRWTDVLEATEESLRLAKRAGYRSGASEALQWKAVALSAMELESEREQALIEALSLAERDVQRADIRTMMARSLSSHRDKVDEALRILQEEVLPVYQRSEDSGRCARAILDIARLLIGEGRHAEALQWLTERALPLSEQTGDSLLWAETWETIATTKWEMGQTDAAVQILRNDVLPVLERSGIALALINAREQLADYLRQRNEPGDHVEADRLSRLALESLEGVDYPAAVRQRERLQKNLQSPGSTGS